MANFVRVTQVFLGEELLNHVNKDYTWWSIRRTLGESATVINKDLVKRVEKKALQEVVDHYRQVTKVEARRGFLGVNKFVEVASEEKTYTDVEREVKCFLLTFSDNSKMFVRENISGLLL